MPDFKESTIDDCLRFGSKPLGTDSDLCERQYIPVESEVDPKEIEKGYKKFLELTDVKVKS